MQSEIERLDADIKALNKTASAKIAGKCLHYSTVHLNDCRFYSPQKEELHNIQTFTFVLQYPGGWHIFTKYFFPLFLTIKMTAKCIFFKYVAKATMAIEIAVGIRVAVIVLD